MKTIAEDYIFWYDTDMVQENGKRNSSSPKLHSVVATFQNATTCVAQGNTRRLLLIGGKTPLQSAKTAQKIDCFSKHTLAPPGTRDVSCKELHHTQYCVRH